MVNPAIEERPISVLRPLPRLRQLMSAVAAGPFARRDVGFYFNDEETTVVDVAASGAIRIARAKSAPMNVKAAMEAAGIRARTAHGLIRSDEQIVGRFEVPPMPRASDLAGAAESSIKRKIAAKLQKEQSSIASVNMDDYHVHFKRVGEKRLLVGAVRKKVIAEMREFARTCGLDLHRIDMEGLVLLAAAPDGMDSFLLVDDRGATLAATVRGEPVELHFEGKDPLTWLPSFVSSVRADLRGEDGAAVRNIAYCGPVDAPADDDDTTSRRDYGAAILEKIREKTRELNMTINPLTVVSDSDGAVRLQPDEFLGWALATRAIQ